MSAALDLYAKLTETTDEKERARLIAQAVEALDARFPQISELATQSHVRESELRLQKEIREVEARLQEQIREGDARLQEQIKSVELQIKQVEVNLHQAIASQTRWMIGGLAVLGIILKLADLLISS